MYNSFYIPYNYSCIVIFLFILLNTDGSVDVTLTRPVFAISEATPNGEANVCVDFIGRNLLREVIVSVSTVSSGTAVGTYNALHVLLHYTH